ncbi:RING/U-box superfamily protein [Arabidopsis thaliana]|uniref:RING/U-box superfamily protein n=1 Tax=Arabidopsis thaliana TaxID=3702 RepID=A0A1P8AY41_ARATH|nr:RING/U-box superfamily protein [Arabidopsis thaliana]ANM61576.1 RING/U-box superfamily protein [Arabidopsis thaliana]|eukprot:NP_001323784.1 RING/U-box superfamily protein [Arabidopsis thaliana]
MSHLRRRRFKLSLCALPVSIDRLLNFPAEKQMSVNDSIDPRFVFHVEDESLRFRVGDSGTKIRELETVGDRHFRTQQGFCGNRIEKDETMYSDGDDEEYDVSIRRRTALIQPGIDSGNNYDSAAAEETNRESKNPVGWELVVREDGEGNSTIDRHEMEFKVRITKPDGNVSNSHRNTQQKRDFASVEKERVTTTSVSSWESLKAILSDPVTGALMNDATILPCGHSFGAGGLKEVKKMKACFTCSQPTLEGSEKPNLSLRIVVHAFRQEEDSDHIHTLKRRKERSDQKRSFCIPNITETPKSSRGIQFPFSIGDHIIIEV